MLPAKYQPNPPGGSGEEDFFNVFYHIWHGGHLEFRIKTILAIFVTPMPGCYIRNLVTFGPVVQRRSRLKVWADDGRTTEASHPVSSPGELKIQYFRSEQRKIIRILTFEKCKLSFASEYSMIFISQEIKYILSCKCTLRKTEISKV